KGGTTEKSENAKGVFAKYDKNKNGVIDGEEKSALRKDYDADKEGELKRFDKNNDGKLDDEEIAAIKPPTIKNEVSKAGTENSGKGKDEKPDKSEKSEKNQNLEKAAKAEK